MFWIKRINMKTALIVIDVQNYFINKHTMHIPQKISDYISKHEKDFDFVLFTKFVNKIDSNYVKLLNWKKCFSSPDTDISEELSKFIDEKNVFVKTAYSAFKSREFSDFLRKNKIKRIFICGIDTDACILATAFETFDLGYDVKILKNLCASHSGKNFHEYALKLMRKNIFKK